MGHSAHARVVAFVSSISVALVVACGSVPPAVNGDASVASARSAPAVAEVWTGARRLASDGSEEPLAVLLTPVLGGAATLRELEVRGAESTYLGLSIDTFDRERGVWLRTYVNAPRGRPVTLVLQASGEDAVRAHEQVWRSAPGADGRCSENRTVHISPDHQRTTVSRSLDAGVTWTPLFIDELRKDDSAGG